MTVGHSNVETGLRDYAYTVHKGIFNSTWTSKFPSLGHSSTCIWIKQQKNSFYGTIIELTWSLLFKDKSHKCPCDPCGMYASSFQMSQLTQDTLQKVHGSPETFSQAVPGCIAWSAQTWLCLYGTSCGLRPIIDTIFLCCLFVTAKSFLYMIRCPKHPRLSLVFLRSVQAYSLRTLYAFKTHERLITFFSPE